MIMRLLAIWLVLILGACTSFSSKLEAGLYANPDQTGIRWGLVVADLETGETLISLRPDDRFTPASNAKIATTMAGFHWLDRLEQEDVAPGLTAHLEYDATTNAASLVLVGGGDALIGDGEDCTDHCLATIADQVVATGITSLEDIVGDDTLYPDERWAPGWSQEDLKFYFGTAVSALSVNDNQLWLSVSPGSEIGDAATLTWRDGDDLYELVNETKTVAADLPRRILLERPPGAHTLRVYGEMPLEGAPRTYRLGIDDPALFAAIRLKRLLIARGVAVTGEAKARHRPVMLSDILTDEEQIQAPETDCPPIVIASLPATPLKESLEIISRNSQNLHAELVLRRLGLINGSGSRAHGLELVDQLWKEAGVAPTGFAISDGSGLSIYHRVSPGGMVGLLVYASEQPWFEDWKATLPIGGVDGTLARSFKDTPLEGKVFAKTGTLNGVNALSGYMIAQSGRELAFSIIANDRPALTASARAERDAALLAIAERY